MRLKDSFALFACILLFSLLSATQAPSAPAKSPIPWQPQYKIKPNETARLTPADVVGPDGIVYPNWTKSGVQGGIPNLKVAARIEDFGGKPGDNNDDSHALAGYPVSARKVSGSMTGNWTSIAPGQSETISYTIELENSGTYSLPPAWVSYNHEEASFSESSDRIEVEVARVQSVGLLFQTLGVTMNALTMVLDHLTGGNGSTVILGAFAVFAGIAAFLEYRGLRKWLSGAA